MILLRTLFFILFAGLAALFAQPLPRDPTEVHRAGNSFIIDVDTTSLSIQFYRSDIIRIDRHPSPYTPIDSSITVVARPQDSVTVSVTETDSTVVLSSASSSVRIHKRPLRYAIMASDGSIILEEPASGGYFRTGDSRSIRFLLHSTEHFYGTGERGTALDKRGSAFDSYNTQLPGYSTPEPTMNINVPLLCTTHGYALFIDNIYPGRFDLGATDTTHFSYTAAGGELSCYIIVAKDIPSQLEGYTWLTGRQPLPPRWLFGYIQSKNRYRNEQEARSIVRSFRDKQIPLDALVLDLAWFPAMGDIAWDEMAWPHHQAMVDDFLSQGVKTILITEPYIVDRSLNFAEADSFGYFAKDSTGHTYLLPRWWSCAGCSAALLDMTNPSARRWWWDKHLAAFGTTVAGIWTDLGEPERHPAGMVHVAGSAAKVHNIYDLLWAKTVFEGFSALHPDRRIVNLTRSGFAGIQRYGVVTWSGDVARSFGGLGVQLPMLLNMGMSGIAYHNSDIGGYSRIPTIPELYVRWMEFGAFCPVMRVHGAGESVNGSPTEPWMFGSDAERICREYIELRYSLLPYNYSLAYRNHLTGMPMARPLFWDDPDDPSLKNVSSSYLWGDAFLVAPVTEAGARTKDVVLPKGRWFNYWTDEIVSGGRTVTVDAPLDRIPLFVRAGSIVPFAPVMQYSDEQPLDTLIIKIYPAREGAVRYLLYEDDGRSMQYVSGASALTEFTQQYHEQEGRRELILHAGPVQGRYRGMLQQRTYRFEIHGLNTVPGQILVNEAPRHRAINRNFARIDDFQYDSVTGTLSIPCTTRLDEVTQIIISQADLR